MIQQHFICLLICLLSFSASAQNKKLVVLDQQVDDGIINIINYKGEVIWQIPAGHTPIIDQSSGGGFGSYTHKFFKKFDFTKSPLPVYSKTEYYLLNYKGEKIKIFSKKYRKITPAIDEYLLMNEIDVSEENSPTMVSVYLDKNGNEVFGGNRYLKASPFSEGLAVVQLKDGTNDWQIINKKGEKVVDFSKEMSESIVSATPFHNGVTLIMLKTSIGHGRKQSFVFENLYFNTEGEKIVDINKTIRGKEHKRLAEFKNDISYCIHYNQCFFYNKAGQELLRIDNINSVDNITKNHILITFLKDRVYYHKLYDKSFNQVKAPVDGNKKLIYHFVTDDYIGATTFDTLKNTLYQIYSAADFTELYSSNRLVAGMFNDKILIRDKEYGNTKLTAIVGFDDKEIYTPNLGNRLFMSIQEALPFKNKAKQIKLVNKKDISGILNFPNLQMLELLNYTDENLPDNIGNLKKLQQFNLFRCNKIKNLPSSMAKLQSLKKISITDCKKLTGLENLIIKLPNLKEVNTLNYNFQKGFIEQMKKERPSLQIFDVISMDDDYETYQDYIEIPKKEVKPAPKKKKN